MDNPVGPPLSMLTFIKNDDSLKNATSKQVIIHSSFCRVLRENCSKLDPSTLNVRLLPTKDMMYKEENKVSWDE